MKVAGMLMATMYTCPSKAVVEVHNCSRARQQQRAFCCALADLQKGVMQLESLLRWHPMVGKMSCRCKPPRMRREHSTAVCHLCARRIVTAAATPHSHADLVCRWVVDLL